MILSNELIQINPCSDFESGLFSGSKPVIQVKNITQKLVNLSVELYINIISEQNTKIVSVVIKNCEDYPLHISVNENIAVVDDNRVTGISSLVRSENIETVFSEHEIAVVQYKNNSSEAIWGTVNDTYMVTNWIDTYYTYQWKLNYGGISVSFEVDKEGTKIVAINGVYINE